MTILFARHQFPPAVIRHAVWLYVRFTLSYRDIEDLLAERGLDISYETVRRWVLKFGRHRQLERTPGRREAIFLRDELGRSVARLGDLAPSRKGSLARRTAEVAGTDLG